MYPGLEMHWFICISNIYDNYTVWPYPYEYSNIQIMPYVPCPHCILSTADSSQNN